MAKVHNFSAGPSILPQEVLQKASEAILNFDDLNLSLIEISHRSKNFEAVMSRAQQLVKDLMNLPEGYSVLFLQGGASLQFVMVAQNLLRQGGKAAYTDTGTWASNAIKEARLFGQVDVIASSKDKNYTYIPKNYIIPADADYFHCTSNNTIFGTQIKEFPESPVPVACDMSSDIFSRKIDFSKFSLIYAGAQKNMGPAGTTLVVVKDEILGKTGRAIPAMMDYRTHISKDSMYNTPPVFAVYVCMLTLEWLINNGGLDWIENLNRQKAELMYGEIDRNPLFHGTVAVEDRSFMNACFLLNDPSLEPEFDKMWKEAGISGIRGHRSVGGYRASMYNALPLESVQVLVDVMREFERVKG
ncbi:MAG: 3-phosphoserine/phosphohydroxythreonine transaminase [Thermaurantimonas sp.]